ncbi:hypothetical protein SAMN05660284_01649 [Formivibrio citricus]|uniref:Uncharacterized protein n=1 Tax=Formivibrio citricus TaxID=83765 RepID=A0A1I4ZIB0_9NEIS|nr:hypothetical protein [Formivibrio citricus]SFN50025.1 hypothetical protein SAMN05660284_01649 [Formivibrio citricus]
MTVIVHRTAGQPAWWLFGAGLAFAAWWGLPLLENPQLENHFFGLFWYSMLALGAVLWAFPSEQCVTASHIERRYCLFGVAPIWSQCHVVGDFSGIALDQEPGLFGRDSVWLLFKGKDGVPPLVFARYRATVAQIAAAQAKAEELARLTGLPFALESESGG